MYHFNLLKKYLTDKFPFLHRIIRPNYGIILEEENDLDHVMGATKYYNWKVLKPDSDWSAEASKMINEEQKGRLFDTMGCTGYGLLNVLEMLAFNKWGEIWNLSDRFITKLAGNTRRGNTMKKVLETVRKQGAVNEADWSWDRNKFNWNEYYKNVPQDVQNKGKLWLKKYLFGYDRVWVTKATLIEALKYSPLYVGGYAWYKKGMLYYSMSNPNHVFVLINSKQMICYDSYSPYVKNLSQDYKLFYVRRIYLEKKDVEYDQKDIDKLIARGFIYIQRTDKVNGGRGQVYQLSNKGLTELNKQQKMEIGIAGLADKDDLTGVSEKDYFELIK